MCRQITYVESSQGFTWNPGTLHLVRRCISPSSADRQLAEIFLPSYVDCDYTPLENRREPVHEIRLSDEEIEKMFPQ